LNLYPSQIQRPPHLITNPGGNIPTSTWNDEVLCMGVNPNTQEDFDLFTWKAIWSIPLDSGRTCPQILNDIINTNNGTYIFNPANFQRVNQDMTYALSKYFNLTNNSPFPGGHNLVLPGQIGTGGLNNWDNFQNTLVNACVDVPGSCNQVQPILCNTCNRNEIANNPDLLTLCGCYAPVLDPEIYTREIPVECDPICNQLITAKRRNPTTGVVLQCTDTVCVLDNISITATKSSVSSISINQVCPGCTAEIGCTCIIDASITNMNESLSMNTPTFSQICPPEFATCIQINSVEQTSTIIPCNQIYTNPNEVVVDSSIPPFFWILALIIVILVLLALACLVFADKNTQLLKPTKPITQNPNITLYNTKGEPLKSTDF